MKAAPFLCLFLLCGLITGCTQKPVPGQQVLITQGIPHPVLDAYWVYLPKNYSKEKKWPMIMYLQGGDAAASSYPGTVKDGGPVYYMLRQQKETLPDSFIIVNPHMKPGAQEDRQWYQHAEGLIEIIDRAIEENNADPNRIYLTGLSRGGHGTWGVAKQYPEKFAAIAPIAGAITCKADCEKIQELPMWIIHNDGDPVIDYEYPKNTVNHFEMELGKTFHQTSGFQDNGLIQKPKLFTTLQSNSHGGADRKAYTAPVFYHWLLTKRQNEE